MIYFYLFTFSLLQTVVVESPLTAVEFMPDGASLAVGSSRGKIYLYDLRMLNSPIKTVGAHKTSVQCIQFQHSSSYKVSYKYRKLCSGCSCNPCSVGRGFFYDI